MPMVLVVLHAGICYGFRDKRLGFRDQGLGFRDRLLLNASSLVHVSVPAVRACTKEAGL
jgi:hypothetical protein